MIDTEYEFLRPIVSGWLGKIESAERYRSKWKEVANECMMFYNKSAAAMSGGADGTKFWQGVPAPRFKVSINKAFELVAIFGPNLFYDIPFRNVEPKRPEDFNPMAFGMDEQEVQQIYQQHQQIVAQQDATDRATAELMKSWLNYASREQPGGGLAGHTERAIVDCLLKGRGCLWTRPYHQPGSGRTLTGNFYGAPEDLLVDPDFNHIDDAKWIARRVVATTWETERRFELEPGTLKRRGTAESMWAYGESKGDDWSSIHRAAGNTNDLIVYYEIFSKTGPGTRLTGINSFVKNHIEDVVGDYAYIVVSPNVPYPLNLPTEKLRKNASDSDVKNAMQWPIPYWTDDRWPVTVLDFYPDPENSWPLSVLAPALGELKFLNTMIPHLCNRIWSSTRDFIAVAAEAEKDLRKHLEEGADQTIIPIKEIHEDIRKVVTFLQQPQTNLDVWRIIEAVSELFDKRTGLNELMYGMTKTQSRTAEDSAAKREAMNIRPSHMQKKVDEWQARLSESEAFVTRMFVSGDDVEDLVGPTGRYLWEKLVMSTDVEKVVRQMRYTVEASSMRRPNKDRDVANINQFITTFMPVAAQSGNFQAIDWVVKQWAKASDMDVEGFSVQPPQPSPEEQQMQQMQMQAEQQKLQAESQKSQMELQKVQMEIQGTQVKSEAEMQALQLKAQVEGQKAATEMQKSQMGLQTDMAKTQAELQALAQRNQLDAAGKVQDITLTAKERQGDMLYDSLMHSQDLRQDEEIHDQKLKQAKEMAKQKKQEKKDEGGKAK